MIQINLSLISILLLCCCGSCGSDVPSQMQVDGSTPYVRCLAGDPPKSRTFQVGRLNLKIEGRSLRIQGLIFPITIAAFSGPAFVRASIEPILQKIKKRKPQINLVLGGLGDDAETVRKTIKALGNLNMPSLVLASGRDAWVHFRSGFAALEGKSKDRVIDITTLHSLRFGGQVWIPVAGAEDGRYARGKGSCGYGKSDLDQIAVMLDGAEPSRRWLISYQAPSMEAKKGVHLTETGVDVGAQELGRFAQKIDIRGGIFAWPYVQAMRPFSLGQSRKIPYGVEVKDLQIVVPRIIGPPMERADGSRLAAGFAIFTLSKTGIRVELK